MATYWENSCSFGLRYYVSWYKYLIVSLVFFPPRLLEWESFPDLCLLVPFYLMGGGGGAGGGSGHRSQRFKTQNHKSQSFQVMISKITDKEFYQSQRIRQFGQCFYTVLTNLQHITSQLLKITIRIKGRCHFNSLFHSYL